MTNEENENQEIIIQSKEDCLEILNSHRYHSLEKIREAMKYLASMSMKMNNYQDNN